MKLRLFVVLTIILSLILAGCGSSSQPAAAPSQPATNTQAQTEPAKQKVDAETLYGKITTGMSYDEVMQIMAGQKPFMTNEGAIDTPTGRITTNNVSWKIDGSVITVIFQDKKVIAKDITKIAP